MASRLPLLMLPAGLAATVSAQTDPPLVLRTAHAPTAQKALAFFEADGPLPPLQRGQNWRLELDAQGGLAAETDESLIGALQISIHPAQLMQVFPGSWASAVQSARETFAQALRDAGLEATPSSPLFDALVDFPQQVAHIRVRVDGDLAKPQHNLNAQVWMRPVPDTWLDLFVKTVRPRGLPTIFGVNPGSALSARLAVKLEGAEQALEPVVRLLVSAGTSSPEAAERGAKAASAYLGALDGSLAAGWNPRTGSMVSILGLRKGDLVRKLYGHPSFLAWTESTRTTPTGFEVEFIPNALTHRGVSLWKSVVRPAESVAARMPDRFLQDEIVSYGGAVGSYLIGVTGVDESFVKGLIERASKHKFRRNILPNMTMARVQLRPARLLEARRDQLDLDGLPKSVVANLGTTGELLFLSLRLQ